MNEKMKRREVGKNERHGIRGKDEQERRSGH